MLIRYEKDKDIKLGYAGSFDMVWVWIEFEKKYIHRENRYHIMDRVSKEVDRNVSSLLGGEVEIYKNDNLFNQIRQTEEIVFSFRRKTYLNELRCWR